MTGGKKTQAGVGRKLESSDNRKETTQAGVGLKVESSDDSASEGGAGGEGGGGARRRLLTAAGEERGGGFNGRAWPDTVLHYTNISMLIYSILILILVYNM